MMEALQKTMEESKTQTAQLGHANIARSGGILHNVKAVQPPSMAASACKVSTQNKKNNIGESFGYDADQSDLKSRSGGQNMNSQTTATTSASKHKYVAEYFEGRFDGFEGLPTRKGLDHVGSSEFTWFGHQWSLRVYPGGNVASADGNVAVYLFHKSDECIEAEATFIVKESQSTTEHTQALKRYIFQPRGTSGGDNRGIPDFAARSTLIGALQGGALVIEVQMRQPKPANMSSLSFDFYPDNPVSKNILKKFMDEESADVVFVVGGEEAKEGRKKRAKTEPTTFYAHRVILLDSSSTLAELCESGGNSNPISINGVRPDIFRHILYHIYGGEILDDDLRANARDIINAADKFGVVNLKLEAEAWYVKSTTITIDNVMDNLLYADSKNCTLLKEAAMDFVVENGVEVYEKVSFENVPSYLMKDLLAAVNRKVVGKNWSRVLWRQ